MLLNIFEGVGGWTHAPHGPPPPQNPPMMSFTVIKIVSPSPVSYLFVTLCKVLSTLHNFYITTYKVI